MGKTPFLSFKSRSNQPRPFTHMTKSQRSHRTHSQKDELLARFIKDVWTVGPTGPSSKSTTPSRSSSHVRPYDRPYVWSESLGSTTWLNTNKIFQESSHLVDCKHKMAIKRGSLHVRPASMESPMSLLPDLRSWSNISRIHLGLTIQNSVNRSRRSVMEFYSVLTARFPMDVNCMANPHQPPNLSITRLHKIINVKQFFSNSHCIITLSDEKGVKWASIYIIIQIKEEHKIKFINYD